MTRSGSHRAVSYPAPRWQVFALIGGATLACAIVGGLASIGSQNFYQALQRPFWAPPPWLFGPVWTVLYVMMAGAASLAYRGSRGAERRRAMTLYGVQLVVNALWTWWFFRWNSGAGALVDILLLAVLIVATMLAFRRARPLAGLLMIPYLVWVLFATALTIAMWRGNPGIL